MKLKKPQNIIAGILKLLRDRLITLEESLQCLVIKNIYIKNSIDKIIIQKNTDKLQLKNIDQKSHKSVVKLI